MNKTSIVMPLPRSDFDPSEAAITWSILSKAGIPVFFATPDGLPAKGDFRMLTGAGLGPWTWILMAEKQALQNYEAMANSDHFQKPLQWSDVKSHDFSALVLPGGHAPGMKEYLESHTLQNLVADFFHQEKLVAAICHGTVLAARSKDQSGKSVLHTYRTTALLRSQEFSAWTMTCLWLGNYYRTYPESVQSEVTRALAHPKQFISGPLPMKRDSAEDLSSGFVVEDRNYISARWPGDAHLFGKTILAQLQSK